MAGQIIFLANYNSQFVAVVVGKAMFLVVVGKAMFLVVVGKATFLVVVGKAMFLVAVGKAMFLVVLFQQVTTPLFLHRHKTMSLSLQDNESVFTRQ